MHGGASFPFNSGRNSKCMPGRSLPVNSGEKSKRMQEQVYLSTAKKRQMYTGKRLPLNS